jgi:hypothetical protein
MRIRSECKQRWLRAPATIHAKMPGSRKAAGLFSFHLGK